MPDQICKMPSAIKPTPDMRLTFDLMEDLLCPGPLWESVSQVDVEITDPKNRTSGQSLIHLNDSVMKGYKEIHVVSDFRQMLPFNINIVARVTFKGSHDVWQKYHTCYLVEEHDGEIVLSKKFSEYKGAEKRDYEPWQ